MIVGPAVLEKLRQEFPDLPDALFAASVAVLEGDVAAGRVTVRRSAEGLLRHRLIRAVRSVADDGEAEERAAQSRWSDAFATAHENFDRWLAERVLRPRDRQSLSPRDTAALLERELAVRGFPVHPAIRRQAEFLTALWSGMERWPLEYSAESRVATVPQ